MIGLFLAAAIAALLGTPPVWADPAPVEIDRETVVKTALASHPLVRMAVDRTRAQDEGVGAALADYYPHLTLSIDQLFLNSAFVGGVFPDYQPIAPELLNPTLTQEITDFGRRHYRVSAARNRLESRRQELAEARLSVVYRARVAFDQLAMFEHLLIAAKKGVEDATLHYRQAALRLSSGFGVVTDVTMARLLLEKTRLAEIRTENSLRKAQADLAYAMGQESGLYRTKAGPPSASSPFSLSGSMAYAMAHRPLLLAAQARDREAHNRVDEVRTRNYPHLSLFAQGYLLWGVPATISGAPAGTGLFLPTFQSGVALTLPIFVGGEIAHETQRARMESRRESEKTRLVRIRIARNIRKLVLDMKTQEETLSLDERRFDNARVNLALVEKRFARGLVDGVTALDAQTELIASRERLVADRYRLAMIQDALDRETGRRVGF
jgi:outer membrane protein